MGSRDESEAIRARAEALDRDDQDLRQQLERKDSDASAPAVRASAWSLASWLLVLEGIA